MCTSSTSSATDSQSHSHDHHDQEQQQHSHHIDCDTGEGWAMKEGQNCVLSQKEAYASLDGNIRRQLELADVLACSRGTGQTYGELVSLGYTQFRSAGKEMHPVGMPNTKYPLQRRRQCKPGLDRTRRIDFAPADGSAPDTHYVEASPEVDEFQIGRSVSSVNDFRVAGAIHMDSAGKVRGPVSRFACRILCHRLPPYRCYVHAGGFDQHGRLSLAALDGSSDGDGLTQYGINLWRPSDGFWHCVTARGRLMRCGDGSPVLPSTSSLSAELEDGSIIDVMGVPLLFRRPRQAGHPLLGPAGVVAALNNLAPQCPVLLHTIQLDHTLYSTRVEEARQLMLGKGEWSSSGTLYVPAMSITSVTDPARRAYVYPACGHVFGYNSRLQGRCSLCRQAGPYVPLSLPFEPAVSSGMPTHVLNPCGHAATKETCEYYSLLVLPDITSRGAPFRPASPFCATPLAEQQPFSKLILQCENAPSGLEAALQEIGKREAARRGHGVCEEKVDAH